MVIRFIFHSNLMWSRPGMHQGMFGEMDFSHYMLMVIKYSMW
ncbi:hypothetical protein SME05J_20030 [Serratia marcescens]|nr:hypothetical protein SME05J_20030 [Serratia marcescens]BEM33290.1 hypothetical protein SME06J_19820 [Serratia marcescens]BEM43501.1 hypothetical protein SME13J_21200 [Serratia marcescens]BEM72498.1 hypothetical protein SME36J_19210 [Serratia marcescens]BEM77893.1 hypothetical protein SME38J_19960 [Serratia marcescens]